MDSLKDLFTKKNMPELVLVSLFGSFHIAFGSIYRNCICCFWRKSNKFRIKCTLRYMS